MMSCTCFLCWWWVLHAHGAWLVPPVLLSPIECFLARHPGQLWPPVAALGRNALQYPRGLPRHAKDHQSPSIASLLARHGPGCLVLHCRLFALLMVEEPNLFATWFLSTHTTSAWPFQLLEHGFHYKPTRRPRLQRHLYLNLQAYQACTPYILSHGEWVAICRAHCKALLWKYGQALWGTEYHSSWPRYAIHQPVLDCILWTNWQ